MAGTSVKLVLSAAANRWSNTGGGGTERSATAARISTCASSSPSIGGRLGRRRGDRRRRVIRQVRWSGTCAVGRRCWEGRRRGCRRPASCRRTVEWNRAGQVSTRCGLAVGEGGRAVDLVRARGDFAEFPAALDRRRDLASHATWIISPVSTHITREP